MATILYKKSEGGIISEWFDPLQVQNAIKNGGWHPSRSDIKQKPTEAKRQKQKRKKLRG